MSGPITGEPAMRDCADLNLYIDGELGTRESLAFEAHAESCPDCSRDLAAYRDLRDRLRADLTRHGATESFRQKIAALAAAPTAAEVRPALQAPRVRRLWPHWSLPQWSSLAAAAAVIVVISSSSTLYLSRPGSEASWIDGVVAAHERAMLSGHEIDVASSSRHVVKPWFSGKTAIAPLVVDLDDVGFPLVGGRLDVPLREPVPALIYRAGPHVVSVYMQPSAGEAPPRLTKVDGFSVLTWRQAGFSFYAVSDADGAEVEKFQAAFAAKAVTMP
jgi:anti-sigma factor RsiW